MSRLTGRTEGRFVAVVRVPPGNGPCLQQMRSSLPKLVRSSRFSSDTVYCERYNHQGSTAGGISNRC
ncbi:MAG TPA: hypothetical protein ENO20_00850 [Bacteroides sp.]|nr:hypothetical protein [Bacteroides sp.]